MEFVVLGALLGLLPAFIAHNKGHRFGPWWVYGALLFIVALPHAILTSPGAHVKPEQLRALLGEIERHPGQTQGSLAVHSALSIQQVIGALLDLKNQRLVEWEPTGHELVVSGRPVPEVEVYPIGSL